MAGGIQKGTQAGTVESKLLDGDVRLIAEAINCAQKEYYYERGHRNLLSERFGEETRTMAQLPELANRGIQSGCVPDGGMWFDGDRKVDNRKLKVVFEAKHQQNGGNAVERWATNRALCQVINPDAVYVTFATGAGAVEGGVLHTYGEDMKKAFPNTKWYYSEEGFTQEELSDIMCSELGLDLTFAQVKPHIGFVISNNFADLFKTPEEIMAETQALQELNSFDDKFIELIQDEGSDLARLWVKIDRDDKLEAREIAIEMLQQHEPLGKIVDTLQDIYSV